MTLFGGTPASKNQAETKFFTDSEGKVFQDWNHSAMFNELLPVCNVI